MEENNTNSEFDTRVDSILNAASEKENIRKNNHWWNNMCLCDLACVVGLIGCIIFLFILDICGLIFNW